LPAADQYAALELFRGTMVRHSVLARQLDAPASASIDCSGTQWRAYVPLRLPDTLIVKERLPPGAAAVLINRRHTYTDLYLPVSANELELIEAIDGVRTIGEIAGNGADGRSVGALFERLWWYDQIVFDASRANLSSSDTRPRGTA
jgi:hypothetical protein